MPAHSTTSLAAIFSGSDVTRTKPDPEIYLKTAAKLHVPPETCVVFEDSAAGVQSGKAAGHDRLRRTQFLHRTSKITTVPTRILPRLDAAIAFL